MALTAEERRNVLRVFIENAFVNPNRMAHSNTDAIVSAIAVWDNALDANVNTLGFVGTQSLLINLVRLLPDPFKTASNAAQKSLLLRLILQERTGTL